MSTAGKTIQIYCPQGEPRGIRIAEITTRIVQAVVLPRAKLEIAMRRQEIAAVGVYYLFGQGEDSDRAMVYVGEAENCAERLKQHHQKKDFWNTAIVVVSRTHSFTKAHGKMLEWMSIKATREANRYEIENANEGSKPFVQEAMWRTSKKSSRLWTSSLARSAIRCSTH